MKCVPAPGLTTCRARRLYENYACSTGRVLKAGMARPRGARRVGTPVSMPEVLHARALLESGCMDCMLLTGSWSGWKAAALAGARLELARALHAAHPLVGLPLRVDHERPAPRVRHHNAVLHAGGVVRQARGQPPAARHAHTRTHGLPHAVRVLATQAHYASVAHGLSAAHGLTATHGLTARKVAVSAMATEQAYSDANACACQRRGGTHRTRARLGRAPADASGLAQAGRQRERRAVRDARRIARRAEARQQPLPGPAHAPGGLTGSIGQAMRSPWRNFYPML